MRAGGESTIPLPEADEVVVFKSFMKVGLRFSLHKMLVEVLKKFEIYLHQLTPEALIKVGVFILAMRSQGLEPDAKCFYNIHEFTRQRQLGRNSITTTSGATTLCTALKRGIPCRHFERSGRVLG